MASEFEIDYCLRNEIPLPHEPATERLRLMASYRPGHYLYHATCAKTGKPILSSVPPGKGITVFDVEAWLDSGWDARSYGRRYDFSRPFFAQFAELLRSVPLPSLSGTHASLENTPYCNFISAAKNCYLVFSAQNVEDCLYGRFLYHSRDIVDSFYVRHSELCYGCTDIQSSYDLHFSEHCRNCSESVFLSACRGCTSCYCCSNLSNKQHCWMNEQLSPEEWNRRRALVDLGDASVLAREKARFRSFADGQAIRCVQGDRYEDSSGNYLYQVKDCADCFIVSESESLDHCIWVNKAKSCIFTVGFGGDSELLYNSTGVGNQAYNVRFSSQCRQNVRDLEYCMLVEANSHDCFGCISVRNASYCILNQQYSRDEYCDLLPRVKEHMRHSGEYGRFFPVSLNPYCYNESDASLFFPIERRVAEGLGFSWSDGAPRSSASGAAIPPHHIDRAGDDILGMTFTCQSTGKEFRIQRKELEFLRRIHVALPQIAPFERIRRAGAFLDWRPVREAHCAECEIPCSTVYAEDTNILCERCYGRRSVEG